ncbi:MAG: prepilin-type N-terminal cleavage/methylation domain-containing protein [Planctomycetota bacterium]
MRSALRHPSAGFTLVELMTVLVIIVFVSAITFPFLGAMSRDIASSNGVNTVQAATTAARAYATRTRGAQVIDVTLGTNAEYSGAAALFTPDNLIRIIENSGNGISLQSETAPGNPFLEIGFESASPVINPSPGVDFQLPLNGFSDVEGREPIVLNPNIGVVGIVRAPNDDPYNTIYPVRLTNSSTTRFIPPPFAVWFNQAGSLVSGIPRFNAPTAAEVDLSRNRVVYYDAGPAISLNGLRTDAVGIDVQRISAGNWRSSNRESVDPYDPDEFDPASPEFDRQRNFSDSNRLILPFEEIEAVVGIVLYDKSEFRRFQPEGQTFELDWPPANPTEAQAIAEWLVDNGTAVFFSPTSGIALRQANEQ